MPTPSATEPPIDPEPVDPEPVDPDSVDTESAVAIVGMAGRFPGAGDVDGLWRNLVAGTPGLRPITDVELDRAGIDPQVRADPRYVRVGGPVAGFDRFDAAAFGCTDLEADTMEPQHRLFLECSWEVLERAGYCPTDPGMAVGVFGGCAFPDYMIDNVVAMSADPATAQLFAIGNERDSLTSLVSYKLGLSGPSLTVQTFCSTSLVAVHLACQSLLTWECDLALAGGAYLPLPQPAGYLHTDGSISAPDGRVRSLDAAANGTVMGSGVGMVALRRLADAIAEGDVIHAVILGSAVNNDGRERAGYTAPGVAGQAAVIGSAQAVAGVEPESVGYVECHSVGTPMGDSIELAALARVFATPREVPCVLGSVKPLIGHLDRAAGVTGLMRAALSLRHRQLPATAGFRTPNPALAAAADRFTVLTEPVHWPAGPEPRRAGVSAFGLGGTNAHVVLQEPPAPPEHPRRPGPHLLTFSAGGPEALAALTGALREHLAGHPELDLADVAHTLQVSRGRFPLRRAVVCLDRSDALDALADPARWIDGETRRRDPQVRVVADTGAPDGWWRELAAAAARLLPAGDPDCAGAAPAERALETLRTGLLGLGVRMAPVGPADPAAVTVVACPRTSSGGTGPESDAAGWVLDTLARVWQAGARIDWSALHGGSGRRVELPPYPFQRRRHWIDATPGGGGPAAVDPAPAAAPQRADPGEVHVPGWRRAPQPTAGLDARLRAAGPWLVLDAGPGSGAEVLAQRLVDAGAEAVVAASADPDSMATLLRSQLVWPRTIVHAGGTQPGADPRAVRALARAFAAEPDAPPATLALLTSGAVGVLGPDGVRPRHAGLAATAPHLARLDPRLAARHVDTDGDTAAEQVLAALVGPPGPPVAVRAGEAWVRSLEPRRLSEPDPDRPAVRAGDVAVVTGEFGAVAEQLARHLAGTCGAVLVVLTPPAAASRPGGDDPAARLARTTADLTGQGARMLVLPADPGDVDEMRAAVAAAAGLCGHIDLVVHGTGAPSDDPGGGDPDGGDPDGGDPDGGDPHRDGVREFEVLQTALGGHAPERRVRLTSLAAVRASAPAAAVDAALDLLVGAQRSGPAPSWATLTWDVGDVHAVDATATFDRLLAAGDRPTVVVLPAAAPAGVIAAALPAPAGPAPVDPSAARRPRPALSVPFVEPDPGVQRSVADRWSATLGLTEVGADDNFFELGGRSMAAVQLAATLGEMFAVPLPVTALVEHPTVRLLGARIVSSRAPTGHTPTVQAAPSSGGPR